MVINMDKIKKVTWRVIPTSMPSIIRHCSKCNKKMNFYCSEKFRANANQTRVDIWLIYKCTKCDSTWKLTISKGIKPRDLPAGLFDKFVDNDRDLAWMYAFDRNFLKQNACTVEYAGIEYAIDGVEGFRDPIQVQLQSPYIFDLKLSALLAKALGVSIGQIKKHVENGKISTEPECDIMKLRIKNDMTLFINSDVFN